MSLLKTFARRVTETRGMIHLSCLRALRDYIKTTPEEELTEHINLITKTEYLRAIWEAGLNATLQKAVLRRIDELIERRKEG